MESNQPAADLTVPASPGMFGTKIPSSVSFIIGIFLFFLPFLDIKCNETSLQKVSGVELATGFRIKTPGTDNSLFGGVEKNTGAAKGEQKDPYVYALAALALGVAGFLLSLLNQRMAAFGAVLTGVLAAGAMIGMMLDIRSDIKKEGLGAEAGMKIAVEFTPWFYVALIAFLAAAFFSYRRIQSARSS